MRRFTIVAFTIMVAACKQSSQAKDAISVPCDTAARAQTQYRTIDTGRLRFEVPSEWQVLDSTASRAQFHVPAMFSQSRVVVEVSIDPHGAGPGRLREITDTFGSRIVGTSPAVDTMPDPNHRYYRSGGEPQTFIDFGQEGSVIVYVTMAAPALQPPPLAAQAAYARDTDHLLSTLTIDGSPVFSGWTLHPTVECPAADETTP